MHRRLGEGAQAQQASHWMVAGTLLRHRRGPMDPRLAYARAPAYPPVRQTPPLLPFSLCRPNERTTSPSMDRRHVSTAARVQGVRPAPPCRAAARTKRLAGVARPSG